MKLVLDILKTKLAVIRLPPTKSIPSSLLASKETSFLSITKTTDELSIVCSEESINNTFNSIITNDADAKVENGWVAFKVRGPLDFAWTGILSNLANPLAENVISIFAISTFDTDYILVKDDNRDRTAEVFRGLGHTVVEDE